MVCRHAVPVAGAPLEGFARGLLAPSEIRFRDLRTPLEIHSSELVLFFSVFPVDLLVAVCGVHGLDLRWRQWLCRWMTDVFGMVNLRGKKSTVLEVRPSLKWVT